MTKLQIQLWTTISIFSILFLYTAYTEAAQKSVAITQIVEHPSLDDCRKGVRDELQAQGFEVGKNLSWTFENAQGNATTAAQIAKKFVAQNPDVIVAISTPSAQTAAAAARNTALVFTAVTDPVGAKLVKSMKRPGGLITGVSDLTPIDRHMELIKRLLPKAKSVGVIYNPGEANSITLVNLVKKYAPDQGMQVKEAGATKSAEVLTAARSLVGKVDAIYVPTDNTVVSAIEAVVKVGIEAKIPIFSGDAESVSRGTVASLGFSYYDVGRQAGHIVVRVLKGEKPGDISVESVDKLELHVNPKSAKQMGLSLSKSILSEADKVIR